MSQEELIAIKDAIDGIYKNEIYDNEYTFEESKYIIKEPMIHLDVDKILEDLKNGCCEIYNVNTTTINEIIITFERYQDNYLKEEKNTLKLNFPLKIKFTNNDEFIIKIYLIYHNGKFIYQDNDPNNVEIKFNMIYITNYGRIILADYISYKIQKYEWSGYTGYTKAYDSSKIIYNNTYYNFSSGWGVRNQGYFNAHPVSNVLQSFYQKQEINLIDQPKLLYRIPKLFIDVIDAFHTQNTDLMQACCKTYLEISRESKVKESIMKDIQVRNIEKEKDKIIADKDKIIEDKDKEIINLKQQILELQQKYNKIKAMFN